MATKLTICLTKRGLSIIGDVKPNDLEKIKNQLSLKYTSKIGQKRFTIVRTLFVQKGPILFFARYSGLSTLLRNLKYDVSFENRLGELPEIKEIKEIKVQDSLISTTKEKQTLKLYPNQQVVHDYLIQNIFNEERRKKGVASCVLQLPTGDGKTYTAGGVIKTINEPTLIVVPNKGVMDEWRKMFANFDILPVKIGEYSSIRKIDGDILIITSKSLIKPTIFGQKYWEYLKKFNFVIYDEVHNYATDTLQEIFWRTYTHFNLGLTATPDERTDEMDELYFKHIGKLISPTDIPTYTTQAPIPWKGNVSVVKYSGPIQYTHDIKNEDGWTQTQSMQKQFAMDPYRTKLILNYCDDLLSKYKNVFIFGEHRDFLDELADKINALRSEKICGVLKGGVKEEEKNRISQLPIICITYCYGKEGISIPKMNAIIFAQSRRNKMTQIIGRILRAGGNPEEVREIIDIVDFRTSLKNQLQTRMGVYKQKNFSISVKKIAYNEIALSSLSSSLSKDSENKEKEIKKEEIGQ